MTTTMYRNIPVHRFDPPPSSYGKSAELAEYDLEHLPSNVVEVWYWYSTAPYEGDGYILLKLDDGQYVVWYMGHCSCYGPLDRYTIEKGEVWKDLEALAEGITSEYREAISELVKAAST